MKTLEQHQWCRSGIFIVNCEHISQFVLVVHFEQANICCVYIEKTNTLRGSSQEMFCEKGVLRNFTNSQENTCARVSSLITFHASKFTIKIPERRHWPRSGIFIVNFEACNFIKKGLWHRCFPMNFAKFLRAPFLTEHLWWLLLHFRRQDPAYHEFCCSISSVNKIC